MKNRTIPTYLRDFNEKFSYFDYKYTSYTVWSDFLELSVCGLAWGSLDDKRKSILEKYKLDEQQKLWELFENLLKIYINAKEVIDPLGDYYQVLASDSSKSHFGQFFTPFCISDFMIDIIMIDSMFEEQKIGKKISDPTCGSGRMLLSANHKYPNNFVFGCDLDRICVLMCSINLCMQGAKGEVCWKNSLNLFEHREIYTINTHFVNGLELPSIVLLSDKTQSFIYQSDMSEIERYKRDEQKQKTEKMNKNDKKRQVTIF